MMKKHLPAADTAVMKPDDDMIALHADVLFGGCEHWVAVRALSDQGEPGVLPHTPFLATGPQLSVRLAQQSDWAAGAGMGLFVMTGTVRMPGQARAEHVVQTRTILVDLDAGDITAKRAHAEHYLGPPTLVVASGGVTPKGVAKLHLYWRLPEIAQAEDIERVCRAREMLATKIGGDLSFKSAHQPIRLAGSIHAKAEPRLVEVLDYRPVDYHLGEIVDAILEMPAMEGLPETSPASHPRPHDRKPIQQLLSAAIRKGGVDGTTRFDALSRVIGYWIRRCRDGHVTQDAAWEEIRSYNAARIEPPWPEDKLRIETERLWQRDTSRSTSINGTAVEEEPDALRVSSDEEPVSQTEDALADAFAQRHGSAWRYVPAWGQWLIWTGSVWRREETLRVFHLVRQVCRDAAVNAEGKQIRTKLSTAATVSAVERLARSDRRLATSTDVWDQDPWLLNTPDGVIDLRSGTLMPHDATRYLTKIAGAAAAGACPAWLSFLDTVTSGDVELQAYLRRVAGYCLTGITAEHAMFFFFGTGANGKSVCVNTLIAILGDYAMVSAMDTFMATQGDRHPTDMAALRGARMVTSIETEQGSRWAESKLKALTGGDKITARFMRQDFFEFTPQFKLLIVGNHKPSIRNVDEAMRRRLHMVPFTVTIPAAKRDPQLAEKLLAERDGILAWALQGCLEWQKVGLSPPRAVMAATEDYFETEDALGRWLADCCHVGPEHWTSSARLFANWKLWADTNGEHPGSMKRFAEMLSARGFLKHDTRLVRGFRGLCLRHDPEDRTE